MATTPVFDHDASLRRMGHDATLFREMISLLREDGPLRLREIAGGVKDRNAALARHAAHTLKGLAANFSAPRAVASAACVEHLAREEKWGEMEPAVAELQTAFNELLDALQPFTRTPQPA